MISIEQVLANLLKKVAIAINIKDVKDDATKNALLMQIQAKDKDLAQKLSSFFVSIDAYSFTQKDIQLRIKADDVWQQQKQVMTGALKLKVEETKVLAKNLNIDISDEIKEIVSMYED